MILATKVVIDHTRIGARQLADRIDPRAAVTLLGEFRDRNAQDALTCSHRNGGNALLAGRPFFWRTPHSLGTWPDGVLRCK
jgi:hypothetical protein